jgi:large-conductance mechanosensitive channel
MGARTVAGAISTLLIFTDAGTGFRGYGTAPALLRLPELSQYFLTRLFYSENPARLCHNYGETGVLMDDSPKEFAHELRSAILKKRVGQIALAVVLAEACIRFLSALIWFLIVPFVAWPLRGHTESVLFANKLVFPWEQLFGSLLEFILAIVFVFYVNRWIQGSLPKPTIPGETHVRESPQEDEQVYYNLAGQPLSPTEQETRKR